MSFALAADTQRHIVPGDERAQRVAEFEKAGWTALRESGMTAVLCDSKRYSMAEYIGDRVTSELSDSGKRLAENAAMLDHADKGVQAMAAEAITQMIRKLTRKAMHDYAIDAELAANDREARR